MRSRPCSWTLVSNGSTSISPPSAEPPSPSGFRTTPPRPRSRPPASRRAGREGGSRVSVAPAHIDPDWAHLRAHVRGMLGGRLASGADAEDVVQEVLLRVFRGTGSLRDGDRFGSWLAAMVRNAVTDQLRARQRHPI